MISLFEKLIKTKKKKSAKNVAYCCFTDTRNIGDYALYQANKMLFPQYNLFFGGNKEICSKVNLFGGGTLYPYCLRTGMFPKRQIEVAIGLGVMDPDFVGKFGILTKLAMRRRKFLKFGVRGPRSKNILERYGIEAVVTGDTALVLQPDQLLPQDESLVGISIVGEKMKRIGSNEQVYNAILKFCKKCLLHDINVIFIPFCKNDIDIHLALYRELNSKKISILDFWHPPISESLKNFLNELQRCSFIIAERLHAAVLSVVCKVPFLSIMYKPKCLDFVESFDLSDIAIIDPRIISKTDLFNLMITIKNNPKISENIDYNLHKYRKKLYDFALDISKIIDHI